MYNGNVAIKINNVFKIDPTRTKTLRRRFVAEMNKRFRKLKGDIRTSIVGNDCFGLKEQGFTILTPAGYREFDFTKSSDKIDAFMAWLKAQQDAGILEIIERRSLLGETITEPWANNYIRIAYEKGVTRADQELRKLGYEIPERVIGGTLMNAPIHADAVGLLYTRTFSELKGITEAMDQQISRLLAQGLAEGQYPYNLAKVINDRVDKIGIIRAKMLARTEIVRAHHNGTINEYKSWGIEGVKVQAEWLISGIDTCPICLEFASGGKNNDGIYTLDEILPLIPAHPNCLCAAIPA